MLGSGGKGFSNKESQVPDRAYPRDDKVPAEAGETCKLGVLTQKRGM